MSIRKRTWTTSKGLKKEAWIVDYSDQAGERHIKTFERKKEADAYAVTVRADIHAGVHTSSKKTVAEAGRLWLQACEGEGLERATLHTYRQHLEQHILPYLRTVKLSELTVPMVSEYRDRLRADGRSPAMVRRVVTDLGAILAEAHERGLVAQNVARRLKRRGRGAEQRHKPALKVGVDIPTPAEVKAIVGQLEGRWRPLLLTATFTGLRASELRGLTWADLDLKRAEVHVRQRADRFNSMGRPKSAAGRRTVPMPPILVNALREWKLVCPKGQLGLVFPTGAGNIERHANIIARGFIPVQVAAGVVTESGKAKYGLHALRHFYASWCINRKADGGLELPLKVVQHRLGHSSLQMTADVYGHLFPSIDDGRELAAAQAALLG